MTSVGENVDKGTLVHCWWECKFGQPLWKKVLRFLKKIKIELLYDLAIPLLGIHPKEMELVCWRDVFILMFVAVLFTIAKIWKQLGNSPVGQWLRLHAFTAKIWMHWQMNGERKCDTHRNITQLLKKRLCHLQQHGWIWRTLC